MSFSPDNLNLVLSRGGGVVGDIDQLVLLYHLDWFRFARTKDMNSETSHDRIRTAADYKATLLTCKQQQQQVLCEDIL